MVLNEQSQKIDLVLENTCKKFEKVALETGNGGNKDLPFNLGPDQAPSKFKDMQLTLVNFVHFS